MPKELIRSDARWLSAPDGKEDPLVVSEGNPPVVFVGWEREASVQIGTRLLLAESPPDPERIPVQYGWYVDVDRKAINDLIRVLRRARDAAYGRDE